MNELSDKQGVSGMIRRHWREITRWAILAGYVLVLWAMASRYWHALKFYYWIAVFILLPLAIILAFKFLQEGAKSQPGASPAAAGDAENLKGKP